MKNSVQESFWTLRIRGNAITHENRTGDISSSDAGFNVGGKMAVSPRIPQRYRGFFQERLQPECAFTISIDTPSDRGTYTQAEKCSFFAEKINYFGHAILPRRLQLSKSVAAAVRRPTDLNN